MSMIPLNLEIYDTYGLQYLPAFRNLRFAKSWQGGEDLWLSFDLDRDIRIDYRDIAYGNDVILRRGLTAIWAGEMRQIDQQEESITINCLGRWVYADDINHGDQQRVWCESRYKIWREMSADRFGFNFAPQKFYLQNDNQLFMAPRKGETFQIVGDLGYGGLYVLTGTPGGPYFDPYVRISFDYDVVLPSDWRLMMYAAGSGGFATEWEVIGGGASSGVKDFTFTNPAVRMDFRLWKQTGPSTYAGETGVDCYGKITNLRLWGQPTESPCMIHVTEDIIDTIEAGTPIDASHDLVQEQLFVRDTFTDNNGVLLANHQPDVDKLRGGWAIDVGGYNIQANEANNTAQPARAVVNTGESDGVVCLDPETPAAGNYGVGIVFRWVDTNNYWLWVLRQTGDIRLRKVVAGVPTNFDTAIGVELAFTYHLMVKLRGDLIEGYVGGILRYSRNDTDHQTATSHGISESSQNNVRVDNFEMYKALPIWPMFYEDGESCYAAMKDVASFGDWNHKAIGWGVEAGGDRLYLREADRETVRYVIPREYVARMSVRGNTHREYLSEAWARYTDEEGIKRWTEKYYVHVTNDGLVVNTTATGDDLASVVYGVMKDKAVDFGRVDAELAVEYLIQHLQERGHPQTKATYDVYGPVQDLHRGGAWIDPVELEMGYLVQMPFFRATEAEGVAGSDLRDADTTFLLVGMEHDHERGITRLIPEGATEDLARIIAYARAFQYEQDREHISKRSKVLGG